MANSSAKESDPNEWRDYHKELLLMDGYIRGQKMDGISVPSSVQMVTIKYFEFVPIDWEMQFVSECSDQPVTQFSNHARNLSIPPDGSNWWTTSKMNAKDEWVKFDLQKPLRLYGYQIAMGDQDWGPKTYRIDAWNNKLNAPPSETMTIVDNVYFEREKGKWEHQKLMDKETLKKYEHFKPHFDDMDTWASTHQFPKDITKYEYWRIHLYEPKKKGSYLALNRVRFLKYFVQ